MKIMHILNKTQHSDNAKQNTGLSQVQELTKEELSRLIGGKNAICPMDESGVKSPSCPPQGNSADPTLRPLADDFVLGVTSPSQESF